MSRDKNHDQEIALEVLAERDRQDAKWGEQNHPDGTGPDTLPLGDFSWRRAYQDGKAHTLDGTSAKTLAACATEVTDVAAKQGHVTWADILTEEHFEALAEADPVKLRAELIQVAAVAIQWVAAIDRREPELRVAILTAADFTVEWDATHTFPFFEDENANGLWGYGHQDEAEFAEAANAYDHLLDPDGRGSEDDYTADDVSHSWGIAYSHGNGEDDWIVSRRVAATDRDLTHARDLTDVDENTPGAFPLTYISR